MYYDEGELLKKLRQLIEEHQVFCIVFMILRSQYILNEYITWVTRGL